jgi:hypothetical protein
VAAGEDENHEYAYASFVEKGLHDDRVTSVIRARLMTSGMAVLFMNMILICARKIEIGHSGSSLPCRNCTNVYGMFLCEGYDREISIW